MLYLDGIALEKIVEKCLLEIGFKIIGSSNTDADLILQFDQFLAVVEIKGVSGSGATKHSRQLEQCITDYSLKNEVDIKGLLILNTFKNEPLNERSDISFPPDMVKFSTSRDHCLMLTWNLLNIFIDFHNKKITIDEIVKLFSETIGILDYKPRI